MAEGLSGLEDVHDLVLVAQFNRAFTYDVKLGGRRTVLDQNVSTGEESADPDRRSDMQQFVSGKCIEWGKLGEEIGDLFHGCNRGRVQGQRQERRA